MTHIATSLQEEITSLHGLTPSLDTSTRWMTLAERWHSENRFEKVIFCYEQALDYLKSDNTASLTACSVAIKIGHTHRRLGHNRDARRYYQMAVTFSQRPDTLQAETGQAYYHLGNLAEQTWNIKFALEFYTKSRDVYCQLNDTEMADELSRIIDACASKKVS